MAEIQRYIMVEGSSPELKKSAHGGLYDREEAIAYFGSKETAALAAQAEEHERDMHSLKTRLHWDRAVEVGHLKSQHTKDLAEQAEKLALIERLHREEVAFLEAQIAGNEPALIQFEHPHLIGEPCMIHRDYRPTMEKLCDIAFKCDVQLWVTHSMRRLSQKLYDKVVEEAERSNHHAGSAVDLNPVYQGIWYASKKMKTWSSLPIPVQNFLSRVKDDPNLRWGGDFAHKDPVHFDDDLVRRDPVAWAKRVRELNA